MSQTDKPLNWPEAQTITERRETGPSPLPWFLREAVNPFGRSALRKWDLKSGVFPGKSGGRKGITSGECSWFTRQKLQRRAFRRCSGEEGGENWDRGSDRERGGAWEMERDKYTLFTLLLQHNCSKSSKGFPSLFPFHRPFTFPHLTACKQGEPHTVWQTSSVRFDADGDILVVHIVQACAEWMDPIKATPGQYDRAQYNCAGIYILLGWSC